MSEIPEIPDGADTVPLPRPSLPELFEQVVTGLVPTAILLHLERRRGVYVRIPTEREVIAGMLRERRSMVPCPSCQGRGTYWSPVHKTRLCCSKCVGSGHVRARR